MGSEPESLNATGVPHESIVSFVRNAVDAGLAFDAVSVDRDVWERMAGESIRTGFVNVRCCGRPLVWYA